MKRVRAVLSVSLLVLSLLCVPFPAPAGGFVEIAAEVRERVLPNGLRFLVLSRHDAPVVSFFTLIGAGAVNEKTGITGVAHVFEHMAFKGTRTIGTVDYAAEKTWIEKTDAAFDAWRAERLKGARADPERLAALRRAFEEADAKALSFVKPNEYSILYETNGALGMNAFTSQDMTGYVVSLPSNKTELWFAVESERFREPVIREFYKEKQVILEERRMRTESSPFGQLIEEMLAAAYKAHPYGQPTIGHKSDIENLTRAQAEAFYREHYTPENTTIAIVGDVSAEEVFALAERYFAALTPRAGSADPYIPPEPPQQGEKRISVETTHQPIVMVAYHMPAAAHPDEAAYDALADILGGGRSSRLYTRLVKEERQAVSVTAFTGMPGNRHPNLFIVYAVNAVGQGNDQVLASLLDEIERVKREGVSDEELAGVKRRVRADLIRSLRTNMGLAQSLARAQLVYGDWRDLFRSLDKIENVTPADVQRVAQTLFTRANRTVATLVPRADPPERPAPGEGR